MWVCLLRRVLMSEVTGSQGHDCVCLRLKCFCWVKSNSSRREAVIIFLLNVFLLSVEYDCVYTFESVSAECGIWLCIHIWKCFCQCRNEYVGNKLWFFFFFHLRAPNQHVDYSGAYNWGCLLLYWSGETEKNRHKMIIIYTCVDSVFAKYGIWFVCLKCFCWVTSESVRGRLRL